MSGDRPNRYMEIRSTVAEWPVGKNKSWSEQDWPISVWWPSSRTGVDGSARAASAGKELCGTCGGG